MQYASLETLKAYLISLNASTSTSDDLLLDRLLTAASAAIDTHCGRRFATDEDTTRYFDALADVDGSTLYLDHDLAAITSITNGNGQAVASSAYTTQPRNETPWFAIVLKGSSGLSWTYTDDPEGAIAVTGRWAYAPETPGDIEQACIRLVGYWYHLKDSQVFDVTAQPETGQVIVPKGMPADVKQLLANYRSLV
jgi:hypothetical protein